MLSSFKLKSHPDKLLFKHLKNVGDLSQKIVNSKIIEEKEFFSEVAYLIGIAHDFGKSTSAFQNMLLNGEKTKYAYHGFLSSLFGYYLVRNYIKNHKKLQNRYFLPIVTWIVINNHHGNIRNILGINGEISKLNDPDEKETIRKQLKDIFSNNLAEVKEMYSNLLEGFDIQEFFNEIEDIDKFTKEVYKDAKKICREKRIQYYFNILFFYSVLLDADKLDASGIGKLPERISVPDDIIDKYKEKIFKRGKNLKINKIREDAYHEVTSSLLNLKLKKDRIFSINLPTGSGKTLTGLSFALKLRKRVKKEIGFTPKIIYSLPFLSIIDQNAKVIKDFLSIVRRGEIPSNLFLKHHHLADIKYKEERNGELNLIENINKSLLLTEGWHSEIVITTFVQFFHSLITNKNRAARKFHNMVNSIIILDEIQAIPYKYWLLVKEVLKYMAENMNCWIILMTATQPLIFGKNEIKELAKNKEKYFKALDRIEYNFDLSPKSLDDFKREIFNQIVNNNGNKDIMIVLNTISSCKEVYTFLREKLSEKFNLNSERYIDSDGICNFPTLELINISTHILPDFRLRRIGRIKKDKKRKVIITTQLVEAGVDISTDIIYRDFAPLDCIIQTAGRCNRNNKKHKGVVKVVLLKDKNNKTFCSYIYDSLLRDVTKEVIEKLGEKISEKSFSNKAPNEYFRLVVNRGTKEDSRKIINHLLRLDFSDISEFKLIKEELPRMSIFIEINNKAKETRKKMEKILEEKERFKKREKLLEIKKNINLYTLSITYGKKTDKMFHLPSIGGIEDFKYVAKNELENWYNFDTGFKSPERINII